MAFIAQKGAHLHMHVGTDMGNGNAAQITMAVRTLMMNVMTARSRTIMLRRNV